MNAPRNEREAHAGLLSQVADTEWEDSEVRRILGAPQREIWIPPRANFAALCGLALAGWTILAVVTIGVTMMVLA